MGSGLAGRVALVSAAASGIGRAVAQRLAAEGARLALLDVDADGLAAVRGELDGGEVRVLAGDAADPATVTAWVDDAVEAYGGIDVLSNNVGVSRAARVGELTDEDWRFQQRLTLDSVFLATRAVLGPMTARGGGSIVSMASGAALDPEPSLGGYAAAKAGVVALMATVAVEYADAGVRANAVTPGPTATPPLLAWAGAQPGGADSLAAGTVLGRLTRPEEVAAVVAFLAGDDASAVTGVCLRCNIRAGRRP